MSKRRTAEANWFLLPFDERVDFRELIKDLSPRVHGRIEMRHVGARDEAKITVHDVPDRPGIAYAILGPIADAKIDVDVIVQNVGHDGMTDLSFTVNRSDYAKSMDILKRQVQPHIKCRDVSGDDRIAKVSLVGLGMRSHVGIASQMFRTLAEEGINIQMITTSEIKISVVLDEKYMELAVRVLHKAFDLDQA